MKNILLLTLMKNRWSTQGKNIGYDKKQFTIKEDDSSWIFKEILSK